MSKHTENIQEWAPDVCPLVPINIMGETTNAFINWRRVGTELGIPIYLYEA